MGLFFKSKKFNDDQLSLTAVMAIKEHPILKKFTNINVISEEGVVQIIGKIKKENYRTKIINIVESKYNHSGLKYKKIEDKLEVS